MLRGKIYSQEGDERVGESVEGRCSQEEHVGVGESVIVVVVAAGVAAGDGDGHPGLLVVL